MVEARAALFVRIYEKKYRSDPYEELEDGSVPGFSVSLPGSTTVSFAVVANVMESGEQSLRVSETWAGYKSAGDVGRYARVDAATDILREAFPRPKDAPSSAPPPGIHAEFSRLFSRLPLDEKYWWWVRERMVLMAATLGLPADLEQIEGYLTPESKGPSELRTRAYALEALARRTGRDTRCDGNRRLADDDAAAAWGAANSPNPH